MENKTAEREKRIAVDFFYWWHNQPGANTEEGFEAYRKSERYKMLDVSITVEADIRDEQLSLQCAEMKTENERLKDEIERKDKATSVRDLEWSDKVAEMKKENERLKAELLQRDTTWLPAKDAELELQQKRIEELEAALKEIVSYYEQRITEILTP